MIINNGNSTKWSAIWAEIISVIQNQTSAQHEFNLKSQVWFQTKIAWQEVQLPLYYIHFEITQIQDLVSSNILLMQYWAGLKLNSSIFGGEKVRVWKQKLQNLPHDTLCLSFSCNLISYFKQALKSDWLFCFSIASSLAGKKCDLRQKIVQFMNKLHQLEPIRLQGPAEISKWV